MAQGFLLGALSVLLVDGACRAPLLAAEPGLPTLIKLCSRLPGYSQPWQGERRTLAARTLCSCIQRDGQVRRSIITSGGNVDEFKYDYLIRQMRLIKNCRMYASDSYRCTRTRQWTSSCSFSCSNSFN